MSDQKMNSPVVSKLGTNLGSRINSKTKTEPNKPASYFFL